jgi:hypothetical protein
MIVIDCKDCGKRHPPGLCGGVEKPKHRLIEAAKQAAEIAKSPDDALARAKAVHNEYMKLLMRKRRGGLKGKPK